MDIDLDKFFLLKQKADDLEAEWKSMMQAKHSVEELYAKATEFTRAYDDFSDYALKFVAPDRD